MDLRGRPTRAPPGFNVDIQQRGGQVSIVEIRPIRDFNTAFLSEDHILRISARTLIEITVREVARFNGWSRNQVLRHVEGMLQMIDNNTNVSAITSNIMLRNVTPDALDTLFDKAHQSNRNFDIFDIRFTFIVYESSLHIGAGVSKSSYKGCYNNINYDPIPVGSDVYFVNCAATALQYLRFVNDTTEAARIRALRRRNFMEELKCEALDNQRYLGWSENVSVGDIKDYLCLVPNFRIVVVHAAQNTAVGDYPGPTYYFDHENPSKNIFFIAYDPIKKHYVPIKSIWSFMNGCRAYDHGQWCYQCSTFKHPLKTCLCGQLPPKIVKRKRTCEGCNSEVYVDKAHRCHHTECRYCVKFYRSDDKAHRCPIHTKKDSDHYLPFIGETGANSKKSPTLQSFDLESRVKPHPEILTLDFTSENGFFDDVSVIDCHIHREAAMVHIPNLAICKNVFTDEPPKIFWDISEFLEYCMTHNDGNNIFLAHNSSGNFIFLTLRLRF